MEKQRAIIEPFLENIRGLFPTVESRVEYIPCQPEISRAETCSLCSKAQTREDTQYQCVFCEGHTHCSGCQTQAREGKGTHKLAHPHSLYKLTPQSDHLDELRYGQHNLRLNPVLDEDPASLSHNGVGCDNRGGNGCEGPVVGTRWKCAHCPDYDFCQNCESLWSASPSEEMTAKAKAGGHELWHVFVLIPFAS